MKTYDTIIIGGGAAAYSAAIYAKRYNLDTVLLQETFGGYTALVGKIENYPGFKSIDGYDLVEKMKEHATSLGVEIIDAKADVVKNEYHCFQVKAGKNILEGKTIILAMGMEHRELPVPRAGELKGKGVHYCATCDGPLYKGKVLAVVGGGDSAVKTGYQLLDMGAKYVYMIVRESDLKRSEPINLGRLEEKVKKGQATIIYSAEIKEILGKKKVEGVKLSKKFNGSEKLALDGIFVEIGSVPRGELSAQLGVRLDKKNQIDVDPRTMATSVDGIFAAGDATNASGSFKQIVTGAAQGAIAATSAYKDTTEHSGACTLHARYISGLLQASKA